VDWRGLRGQLSAGTVRMMVTGPRADGAAMRFGYECLRDAGVF
jgi:hypothetical protein